jgi:hypothetical protein
MKKDVFAENDRKNSIADVRWILHSVGIAGNG